MGLLFITAIAAVAAGAFGQQSCGIPPRVTSNYILGGDDAKKLEFPWQISLQEYYSDDGWFHMCGGSIIDKNWILTAAHCVYTTKKTPRPLRVVIGAHNLERPREFLSVQNIRRGRDITIHRMYDDDLVDYDFALIQLPTPLDFNGTHSDLVPICLPNATDPRVFENTVCITTGWGHTSANGVSSAILQKLPVVVPTHERCVRAWRGSWFQPGFPISPRQICGATTRGEGSGVCQGDSGGPMQCLQNGRWVLAGVASFIKYCGANLYPNVYARVTSALNWIERVKASETRRR